MKRVFRVIGITIGIFVGIVLIIIGVVAIQDKYKDILENKVRISISYDTVNCKEEYPLHIWIFNGTRRTISNTNFDIGVYQKGYSSNISSYDNDNFDTDKIITPFSSHDICFIKPKLERSVDNERDLIYSVVYKNITFEK